MAKSVRCLLRWHRWRRTTTDDGEPYLSCVRCGALADDYHPPGSGLSVG